MMSGMPCSTEGIIGPNLISMLEVSVKYIYSHFCMYFNSYISGSSNICGDPAVKTCEQW